MELNRDAWYVRFAFFDEKPPERTSLCALFWRIALSVGWILLVLFLAASHTATLLEERTPLAYLVGLAFLGLFAYIWRNRYSFAKWVLRCSLTVLAGSYLALLISVIWTEWGWALLWTVLLSVAIAAAICFGVIGLIFGCIHLTDRLSQSESSVVAMLRGIKQKACPLVELKQK